MQYKFPKKTLTESGLVHDGPADLGGFFVGGLDVVMGIDMVLTIFDGTDATGSDYILPPTTIDGNTKDIAKGSFSFIVLANKGIYATMVGKLGTIKVTFYYKGK